MIRTLSDAAAGVPDALQGVSALAALIAFIPSAIIFIVNQLHQNRLLRDEKHRYVIERYQYFLERCLEFPELRLAYGEPARDEALTEDERYRRDILFDLLTSVFERAFLTYANRISSDRKRQWGGWDAFIDHYAGRPDYRDWWVRVVLEQKPGSETPAAEAENATQYDLRFERYLADKLRSAPEPRKPSGRSRRPAGTRRAKPSRKTNVTEPYR
jgi:hypothetical protein